MTGRLGAVRHDGQAEFAGRLDGDTRTDRPGDDPGGVGVDELVDEFADPQLTGRRHGPHARAQPGEVGHERGDRVVAEDGDAVIGAGRELQQPYGRPLDPVGEPGPGQRTPVVHQGGLVRCLLGAAVEWWKGHGSSGGSSVFPCVHGEAMPRL